MTTLRIIVPGNPWDGRVNARHGARAIKVSPKKYRGQIFTEKAYAERQDRVAYWVRAAVARQGIHFRQGAVEVGMTFYSPKVCRRFDCEPWVASPDVDGPEKCHLDAMGQWLTRNGKKVPGGGALSDDVQVVRMVIEKRVGDALAVLTVRRLTGPGDAC